MVNEVTLLVDPSLADQLGFLRTTIETELFRVTEEISDNELRAKIDSALFGGRLSPGHSY